MSPDQVVPVQEKGEAVETAVFTSGLAAMRMSPNRASPCTAPVTPSACPPSATMATLTLVTIAQVWKARRIAVSHAAVDACPFNVRNKLLDTPPPALVPSGAKLSVRLPG